jgi:hypothetical protein
MINLNANSIVYIFCPSNFATGGPELLHQLAHKLKTQGVNALMFYYPVGEINPVHPNYEMYHIPYTTSIQDDENNVLIIPEAMVLQANYFKRLSRIRKCIWWLSIENFFFKLRNTTLYKIYHRTPFLKSSKIIEELFFSILVKRHNHRFHLAQSHYAIDFLKKRGVHAAYLSDYLNKTFIESATSVDLEFKENLILYNPKKGFEFTNLLINHLEHFRWIPLENLRREEVVELLKKAKVYVDFGNHPGKDRFPREAAILKCCVITSRNGSARYMEDVYIPDKYKIEDRKSNIEEIGLLIDSCFENYEMHSEDFDSYRSRILLEEAEFNNAVTNLFNKH